jgi:hypothetical protein
MTETFPRQPLPPVRAAAGGYCTPDPDQPHVMTAWKVDKAGGLHRFPPDQRWEPRCPRFADVPHGIEREEARNAWYRAVYYPWKRMVIGQINANPAAAAREFIRRYPQEFARQAVLANARDERKRQDVAAQQRRRVEGLLAAALVDRGRPISAVARILDVGSRKTARERIEAGREVWAADAAGARAELVAHHAQVLGRDAAETFIGRLLGEVSA